MEFGSADHRALMCRFFIDTHLRYEVDSIDWPRLSATEQVLLENLPVWEEAVNTEYETALLVRAAAEHESDPVLAEAIGLQAFEEERHSSLVSALTEHYRIHVTRRSPPCLSNPTWAFRRSGWGECIDSFVAFGVFALAQRAEIFPKELVALFDVVMQEEARHILFFENWRLYRQHRPGGTRVAGLAADLSAVALDVATRLKLALSAPNSETDRDHNFLLAGAKALEGLTPRSFVGTCLAEHARRLSSYGFELARPQVVPALARALRPLLPNRPFMQSIPDQKVQRRAGRCLSYLRADGDAFGGAPAVSRATRP